MVKEKNLGIISRWWPTFLALISALIGIILNLGNISEIPYSIWLTLAFLIIQNLISENSVPKLYISDCGIDPKTFITGEMYMAVFVDVCSKRAVATDVFPTVEWVDESCNVHFENTGRWFIPTEDLKTNIIGNQTVNLFPNGMPRRLHFGRLDENGFLCAWYRRPDGLDATHYLKPAPSEFIVKITFRSGNKGICIGKYLIKNQKSFELEVISLENKKRS
ncbi:hypothetical protein [Pelolinea submarina]|uniref:Uncharacterized protein n=1 Tax=Pelolinea submarina TaxID=913107 RepID=A0A3E0A819_9CHLR|nr:hypothetical protein [Pelolinea submarina]REG07071.1 hypothetical protein DFR64_2274 [Pelolinea submarina]